MILTSLLSDLKKRLFTTILLLLFIFTSALLFSSAISMISELSRSITSIMEKAQTPDFMQMHSGKIDYKRLENFAKQNSDKFNFQISPILNINGSQIYFNNQDISDSVMDNGFCYQNKLFDFLLDSKGKIIGQETEELQNGQIYIPLNYWNKYSISINDKIAVCNKQFVVKDFLRDSQMDSDMASSKRFLITYEDYQELLEYGNEEFLIEIKTIDNLKTSEIENIYTSAGLETNGPVITHSLFFLLNALSNGVLIVLIILISILLVFVSFLCIRFTLLATLEDDYKEIGVMKAVGFYHKEISSMYLAKYSFINFSGCVLGFAFSFGFKKFLMDQINLFVSDNMNAVSVFFLPFVASCILFFCIFLYVKPVLQKIKKISSSKAVKEDKNTEMYNKGKSIDLLKSIIQRIFNTNVFLGIQDVLCKKKMFITLFLVFVLAVFIMIVPQNIYQTINDSSFVNYMGISDCNARIDLQQVTNITDKAGEIEKWLQADQDVDYYDVYIARSYKIENNNEVENLRIESGNHLNNTIKYIKGKEPKSYSDIALSYICANNLEKKIGDELVVCFSDTEKQVFKVCGVYSDVTNGGITAKIITPNLVESQLPSIMWYIFYIQYKTGVVEKKSLFNENFYFGKFTQINEYIKQTVGSTINTISLTSKIAFIISLFISILITTLFLNLIIVKDDYSISVLHSLGFSIHDIRIQYITRIVFTLLLSLVVGTILANTVGLAISNIALSNIGIINFSFVIKPYVVYLLLPFSLLIVVLISSSLSIKIKSKHI